jgi:glycosyltransferase involved in cell wall biosynthesis
MDECKALAKGRRVHFLGVRSDVPNLLAAADAVVLSSKHEGMSLSVLEGMASGKPMIASDVEGMRDLVGGAGLLFPQGDADALAALIREVCENPEKAREIGRKCRERAMQYDIAETTKRYHALYEEVLTEVSAKARTEAGPGTPANPRH